MSKITNNLEVIEALKQACRELYKENKQLKTKVEFHRQSWLMMKHYNKALEAELHHYKWVVKGN